MASDVLGIYEALSHMTVAVGAVVPRIWNLSDLKASLPASESPARLLLPFGTRTEGRAFNVMSVTGRRGTVTWQITDLLLWKSVQLGMGIGEDAPNLGLYMMNYLNTVPDHLRIAENALIEGVALDPGVFNYPTGSKEWWRGVDVTLTIKEII
jgi:hypothetical protein